MKNKLLIITLLSIFSRVIILAQDNYEIQVYPSETAEKGSWIFELHSNFTSRGKLVIDGVRPTQNAYHETLEVTHGLTKNSEIGFYFFTNIQPNYGWQWVGCHIRARFSVPESWNWPFGAGISAEIGFQHRDYATDTWSLECRPIIDKDTKVVYIAFNPVLGKALRGLNEKKNFDFEPNFKLAFHICKIADIGTEYYGSTGVIFQPEPVQSQTHALFATIDLNLSPDWELNFGSGWGLTKATDGLVFKIIVGYKLSKASHISNETIKKEQ